MTLVENEHNEARSEMEFIPEAIVTIAENEWPELMRLKLQERCELKFKSRTILSVIGDQDNPANIVGRDAGLSRISKV